ncbi:MAG: hypothetical protein M1825_004859 [Sarcosagium campestre]|nr:MAG: hypothetical protein M1825_004859 [Sarcosagium campestre]
MENGAGMKRKADKEIPAAKRGKPSGIPQQKTLEESLPDQGATSESEREEETGKAEASTTSDGNEEDDEVIDKKTPSEDESHKGDAATPTKDNHDDSGIKRDVKHEESTPSAILEKGIFYLFYRGRVGVQEPHGVQDVARTYLILRPMPHDARLGQNTVGAQGDVRLLAIPKKKLPSSQRDRFMIFVEKAASTIKDIKDNFVAGTDYTTQTAGDRHSPAATPAGEGVYSLTTTGRESHFAYILTRPSEMNEVQKDLGLRERGSFVVSAKNPQVGGPSYATLSTPAKYCDDIQEEFRGRGWMPLQARMLDYENAQFLFIGEAQDELGKAVEEDPSDKKAEKDTPLEEMEKLEREDQDRIIHMKDNDPVFADLKLDAEHHNTLQSTW